MFRSITLIAAATLLSLAAACTDASAPNSPPSAPAPLPPPAERSIEGRWQVQALDDHPWDFTFPIRVTITGDRIRATSQCVWFDWDYVREGDEIRASLRQHTPTSGDPYPPVMCSRALAPSERAFDAAVTGASTVQLGADELVLDGDGGRVVMVQAE